MRYPSYPEYKDSGVQWLGQVPEHWEVKRLKFTFPRLFSGVSVNAENTPTDDDSVGVLKTSCVYGNRFTATENKRVLDDESERVACQVTADSLVISRMNTPELVGNCGYVSEDYPNLFLPDRLWIARFASHQAMHGKFAWYLCISDGLSKLTGALATGTSGSMKNLSQEAFLNIDAIVPPILEQTAIADFLDRETGRIDTLVAKKRRLIELLKEKRSALISRTVTRGLPEEASREFALEPHTRFKDSGIEWLGDVPELWRAAQLRRISLILDCKHRTVAFVDDGIPVASIREVHNSEVDLSNAKKTTEEEYISLIEGGRRPRQGDIIYSRNATVGDSALVTTHERFCMGQDVCLIRMNKQSPRYFLYLFRSVPLMEQLESLMIGSTFRRINVGHIHSFWVCVPPINEQTAIASYLDRETARIDRLTEKVDAAIQRLQEYRTALISAAVTGKIDVRNLQPQQDVA